MNVWQKTWLWEDYSNRKLIVQEGVKRSSPFWKFQFDSLRQKTALLVNEGGKRGFGALVRRRRSWCKIHWNAAACPDAVKLGHPVDIPVRPRLFWCLKHVSAWTLATHTGLFESFKTNWLGVYWDSLWAACTSSSEPKRALHRADLEQIKKM